MLCTFWDFFGPAGVRPAEPAWGGARDPRWRYYTLLRLGLAAAAPMVAGRDSNATEGWDRTLQTLRGKGQK